MGGWEGKQDSKNNWHIKSPLQFPLKPPWSPRISQAKQLHWLQVLTLPKLYWASFNIKINWDDKDCHKSHCRIPLIPLCLQRTDRGKSDAIITPSPLPHRQNKVNKSSMLSLKECIFITILLSTEMFPFTVLFPAPHLFWNDVKAVHKRSRSLLLSLNCRD